MNPITQLRKFLLKFKRKFTNFIKRNYSDVYRIATNHEKYQISRKLFAYFCGLFLGMVLWDQIIVNLSLSFTVTYWFLIGIIILFGMGCSLSSRFRCISLLITLGFFGKTGRSFLKGLVFSFIISGPIANLGLNAHEIVRVFTCSTELSYNLTKTRFDLMVKPFHGGLISVEQNLSHITDSMGSIDDVVAPIMIEIAEEDSSNNETVNDKRRGIESLENRLDPPNDERVPLADFYRQKYITKNEARCIKQIRKGAERCVNAFRAAYDNCYDKLPMIVNTILCWPMKITFVCNIGETVGLGDGKGGVCDPEPYIDRRVGENYVELMELDEKVAGNLNEVNVSLTNANISDIPGSKRAKEITKSISRDFDRKKTILGRIMSIFQKMLSFLFLKVIFESISYHNNYLGNIEHDNLYVTEYFKKIDRRRKDRCRSSLLPLKKIETTSIEDSSGEIVKYKAKHYQSIFGHIVKLLLELITASCFIALDRILYISLDLVARHSKIDYHQEGTHIVNITVNGTGIIAEIIRKSISGFNMMETVSLNTTNEMCLPKPSKLNYWFYIKVYGTFFAIFLFIYNEIRIQRFRRIFLSFFYPKMEKQRTLHLYNKLLKRRKGLYRAKESEIREGKRNGKLKFDHGFFVNLRLKRPRLFDWLKRFKCARRSCVVCGEFEPATHPLKSEYNFSACQTPGCTVIYCSDCWQQMNYICIVCCSLYRSVGTETEDEYFSEYYKTDISDHGEYESS